MAARKTAARLFALAVLVLPISRAEADLWCEIDHAVFDGTKIAYGRTIEVVGRCPEKDFLDLSRIATLKMAWSLNGPGGSTIVERTVRQSLAAAT
jgi:hypothetical protein